MFTDFAKQYVESLHFLLNCPFLRNFRCFLLKKHLKSKWVASYETTHRKSVDVPLVATQFIKTFEKFLQCETDTLLPKKYMLFERLNYVAI